jgi:hypothetical protein
MANQIIIDIGAVANDGTGDPLRTAFGYVNDNFSNIWTTGVANSNIQFDGNRILTTNTNGNLVLSPNGIGKVQSNVDIVPNANNALSLGSLTRQWNTVYAQNLAVGGNVEFNDLTVDGNLTVTGNIIQIGNIVTDSKTIQLANTAGSSNAANGSGITVGANDNIATMLYSSTSNVWTTNIGISATGNITGSYFVGNGSLLTGISSYGNANVAAYLASGTNTSNIVTTNTVSANNINFTNNLYGKTGTFTGDATGDNSIYAGYPLFTSLGSDVVAQFSGNVDAYTQFNFQNGNTGTQASGDYVITADNGNDTTHFINLGITGSGWNGTQTNSLGNRLGPNDGYLYVQDGDMVIGTSNGAIETWKFDQDGNLTIPGSIVGTDTILIDNRASGNSADIQLFSADDITLQARDRTAGSGSEGGDINIYAGDSAEDSDSSGGDIQILAGDGGAGNVDFASTGGFITIRSGQGGAAVGNSGTSAAGGGSLTLQAGSAGDNNGNIDLGANGGDVVITAGLSTGNLNAGGDVQITSGQGGANASAGQIELNVPSSNAGPGGTWSFNYTGNLNLPNGGSIIVDGGDGVVGPNGDNMVISWDNEDLVLQSVGGDVDVEADNGFNIRVNYDGGANDYLTKWVFAQDNEIVNITGNSAIITEAGNLNLQGGRNTLSSGNVQITAVDNGVAVNTWTFDNAGVLTVPGNIVMAAGSSLVGEGASPAPNISGFNSATFGANVTATGNISGGNLITGGRAVATGNIVTGGQIQSSAFTGGNISWAANNRVDFQGAIKVGGTGQILSPGGAASITLNNNGANIPTLGVTIGTAATSTTTGALIVTGGAGLTGNLYVGGNIVGNTAGFAIGYRDIPQVSFTGNATIATTDAGKHFYSTQSSNFTLTIANNASQGFQVGAAITVVNQGTGTITIAQDSGVNLYLAGNATAGNRSVSTFGMATIMKVATDTWFINGTGVS